MTMEEMREMVREFGTTFDVPTNEEFCLGLVVEEVNEAREALRHLMKELADLLYVTHWAHICGHSEAIKRLDGPHMEALYKCYEGLQVMGGEPLMDDVFARVHASNMSKRLPDGTILRDENGKVLKPHFYQPPNFEDLI